MSFNQKPTNLQNLIKEDEMSMQEHNLAMDNATEIMIKSIIGNLDRTLEIKALFYGTDTLTDNDIQDIYEMALSIIESEGL